MVNKDFIKQLQQNFDTGLELIRSKNLDYGSEVDPFKNFRMAQLVGVSVERAILVRVSDKLARISNLLDKEAAVKDETIDDTLIDSINYLNILLVYLQSKR